MSAPRIPEGPEGQIVRDIFRAYHLDPDKPEHWFATVKALAELSKKKAKPGSPKKWTDHKLLQLAVDFEKERFKSPSFGVSSIARRLAKQGDYSKYGWKTLRRKLYNSRNPARNSFLNTLPETIMEEYEVEGGNTRERLLAFLTTGTMDVFEDEAGRIFTRPRGLRLVRK